MQRGVALEALGESGSSFGAKVLGRDAASMEAEAGAEACQRAVTGRRTLWGGGALERGHGAALEPFTQLGDVEVVLGVGQAARMEVVSMGADTKAKDFAWRRRTSAT